LPNHAFLFLERFTTTGVGRSLHRTIPACPFSQTTQTPRKTIAFDLLNKPLKRLTDFKRPLTTRLKPGENEIEASMVGQ
jgi:hypothetical protein